MVFIHLFQKIILSMAKQHLLIKGYVINFIKTILFTHKLLKYRTKSSSFEEKDKWLN